MSEGPIQGHFFQGQRNYRNDVVVNMFFKHIGRQTSGKIGYAIKLKVLTQGSVWLYYKHDTIVYRYQQKLATSIGPVKFMVAQSAK